MGFSFSLQPGSRTKTAHFGELFRHFHWKNVKKWMKVVESGVKLHTFA